MRSRLALVLILIVLVAALMYRRNAPGVARVNQSQDQVVITSEVSQDEVYSIVAEKLSVPWEVEFLPNGDSLITERSGRLLKLSTVTHVVQEIDGVVQRGESGLLGLALHPNFSDNSLIFLYLTTSSDQGLENIVVRYKYENDQLSERTVILEGINGSSNHDGGRIEFGPDGFLYITTGDAESPQSAQDPRSLNGKILRIGADGSIPEDNPFQNEVYSLGHRNPQGLAWDSQGRLWSTEHGPSGAQSGYDEVNLIQKGGNYGWPLVRGTATREGFIPPVVQSGSSDTWAPSSLVHLDGNLYFTGLRGEALYIAQIKSDSTLDMSVHFKNRFGRLRNVSVSPSGSLYISTSNKDGRGSPKPNDDILLRVEPSMIP